MNDRDTFQDFINELIDKNDILEVVRQYVDLTRKGNSYWGRCPFHHEKTASFHVEERLKIYKCFGCGAAGNVIKFVQEIESVSFMEAVKILADRVGMKVPEFNKYKKDDNLEEKKKLQELHYKLVAIAARYYNGMLLSNDDMMAYLNDHGVDKKTIMKYGIGYSPSRYGLVRHFFALGYGEDEMEGTGTCANFPDDTFQDVMAGRIICPHINTFGKVSGFAGSLRNGDTIYTRNTDIFRRDSEVFGTHILKQIKMQEKINNLIITNSPINAVVLYAHGYNKVVSCMDNTISAKQARALMRYTDKFTAVFSDINDGLDKSYAGMNELYNEGASVKIATLLEHVNVLDEVENKTFDALKSKIKGASSLIEYQIKKIADTANLDSEQGKEAFIDEARQYIMTIKERSKQDPYISVVAKIAKVSEDAIRKRYYNDVVKNVASSKDAATKKITNKKGKVYSAMMSVLGLLHNGYPVDKDLTPYLAGEYLDYYNAMIKGEEIVLSKYFNDKEVAIIEGIDPNEKTSMKLFNDCYKLLVEDKKKRDRDAIIAEIEAEPDIEKRKVLIKKLQDLMRG